MDEDELSFDDTETLLDPEWDELEDDFSEYETENESYD